MDAEIKGAAFNPDQKYGLFLLVSPHAGEIPSIRHIGTYDCLFQATLHQQAAKAELEPSMDGYMSRIGIRVLRGSPDPSKPWKRYNSEKCPCPQCQSEQQARRMVGQAILSGKGLATVQRHV
jgi:hypothetical protein